MQIWIHSDWHLWHENIYTFTYKDADGLDRRVRERFNDAREGDAYIEQRWRDLIRPEDHVYCLGDLTMQRGKHRAEEFIKLFRSLPGHKRLILGNHDQYHVSTYSEAGFQKVKGSNMIDGLLLTHYPVHPSSLAFKVKANLHGHIHQNQSPPGKYINCCVEVNNYEPIPLEELKLRAAKLEG
jgi:calcineurin-like phosphoesterase family protein